jgi:hypothetical protein
MNFGNNYPEPEEYAHQPSGIGGQQCTEATPTGVPVNGRSVHARALSKTAVVDGAWLAAFEAELNRAIDEDWADVPF